MCLGSFDGLLASIGDVRGTLALEDLLGFIHFLAVVGMDVNEHVALADLALVLLGFVLGDPQTNERTGDTTGRRTDSCTGQSRHDGTCSDERTDAGDRERADANQPAQPAAQHAAGSRSSRSAFG